MFLSMKESLTISALALLTIFSAASVSKAQGGEKVNKPRRDGLGSVTLPAKPKEGTDAKPSYPTGPLTIPAIRDLIVSPTMTGMTLTFNARGGGPVPAVEIASTPPATDSHNHSSFHPAIFQFNPVVMKNKSTPKETAYAGGSYQANIRLEHATRYYYIITLPPEGSYSEFQLTGSFITFGRKIRVTYARIKILDDSDTNSSGDLFFYFYVNPQEPTERLTLLGNENAQLDWESGHVERLRSTFSSVIENAPDRLRLLVAGYDDDSDAEPFGCILKPTKADPLWFEHLQPERVFPGTTCEQEINYAKAQFDLSSYHDKYVNIPFTITSMPLGPHGVRLAFDVSGYIEFTNPDVP